MKYSRLKTNEHGVHSPFVFDLYNHVFKDNALYYGYQQVEEARDRLLKDEREIRVLDLGAGSVSGKGKSRTVKQITRTAAKGIRHSRLLFRLVNYFQPETILELGTSVGISTMYLAIARSKSRVITIEGCPETQKIARENFRELELNNIHSVNGNFDKELPEIIRQVSTLDLVFFDGNHRKEPTLDYFHQCLEKANNESVFIFDDIYWSKEMAEAWEIIKAHPKVTVTIDIFQMGIVFFRAEQAKQHFVLAF